MVDYLSYYAPVLNRAVDICNQLIAFFKAEQKTERDRFAQAASETETLRDSLLRRMASPKYLTPEQFDSSNITGFMAFYDNHAWNNYGVSLPADKLAIRDQLLAAWIAEVVEPVVKLQNELEGVNG